MCRLLTLLLSTVLSQLQFAQSTNQGVSVPSGTGVEIELLQDLSSQTLQAGQAIPFRLVRPIEVKGETLLPVGTSVTAIVETSQKAGHWGKKGTFDLRFQPLKLVDGTLVHIDFARPQKKSEAGEKAERAVELGLDFPEDYPYLLILPILKARKGKAVSVRSGERYLVYVISTEAAPAAVTPAESTKR
jgi:hypothetical protein